MKKILIILSVIILILVNSKETEKITIPDKSIRIRVLANSNNIEDQMLKLKVKNNITKELYKNLENIKTIEDARKNIKDNLYNIDKIVKQTLNNTNYTINYGTNYSVVCNL